MDLDTLVSGLFDTLGRLDYSRCLNGYLYSHFNNYGPYIIKLEPQRACVSSGRRSVKQNIHLNQKLPNPQSQALHLQFGIIVNIIRLRRRLSCIQDSRIQGVEVFSGFRLMV